MMAYAVLFALLAICAVDASSRDVIVERNRIFVNGQEWLIKGVDYSPTPLGRSTMASTGYGGTGFCSSKVTPWFEWKSACYDSDYFDGSSDIYTPSRFPQGFAPIWQRDFANIKALGTNTIRIYNSNPSTKAATLVYSTLYPVKGAGKDHTQFMALLEQYGIMVIYPLLADETLFDTLSEFEYRRLLRFQIDEVGNSSALLMWQLGNEMYWSWQGRSTLWNDTATTAKFNRYVDYIRQYTYSKWGRRIPVTAAMVNIQSSFTFLMSNYHVDIFSSNVFGDTYDSLFNGYTGFPGMTQLCCQTNKAFVFTEMGHTYKAGQGYTTGNLNGIWYNIMININKGLNGALYFEQTDEPSLGKDFGCWSVSVNTVNGLNSTSPDGFIADKIAAKQQYYDLKQGTYNGQPYNMRSNMFTLLGRSPYTLSGNNPDSCLSVGSFKSCPGTYGLPKCNGNGVCNRVSGTCTCVQGWTGSGCTIPVCPGTTQCSGRGTCSTLITPPECFCNDGYFGIDCSLSVSSIPAGTCPNNCSQNGLCDTNTGMCNCFAGAWVGPDCSVTSFGVGDLTIKQFFVNCYADNAQQSDFALTAPASSLSVTNQACRYYCAIRGYTYSGTQSGGQCRCDNSIGSFGTSTQCTTTCQGDSAQLCGGTLANSAYLAGNARAAGYRGCYAVNPSSSAMTVLAYDGAGTKGSIDSCRTMCQGMGYSFAGIQAGTKCYCGNSAGQPSDLAADSSCNTPCAQDNTIMCGGSSYFSVYLSVMTTGYAYY